MSEKFTPRPWWMFENGGHKYPGIDADGCSVVVYGTDSEYFGVHGRTDDEAKANSHLIAAAPDLYAALEDCVSQIRALCSPGDVPESSIKALKKARGE